MAQAASSNTVTRGIRVHAQAQFLPDESDPDHKHFQYVYRIRITNEGTERAKLKTRHWLILDADNHRRDVRGPGVVGKYPDLAPGENFEYVSSCPLATNWGTMEGSFQFERPDGETFEAAVGRFFLAPTAPRFLATSPR